MKKILYILLLIMCCCFISFFIFQSSSIPEKIANVSGWAMLALNPLLNLRPTLKARLMICVAKIVNYNTELKYNIRIDAEDIDLESLENGFRNNLSNFKRLLKSSSNRWNIELDKTYFDISISSDSIYISFQRLKIGYRDVIKEIDTMNEIVNDILTKVIKKYDETIFDCVIEFDNKNPYLGLMINDKIENMNVDVTIRSNNFLITNNAVKYTDQDIVKFSNKLKKELLLK